MESNRMENPYYSQEFYRNQKLNDSAAARKNVLEQNKVEKMEMGDAAYLLSKGERGGGESDWVGGWEGESGRDCEDWEEEEEGGEEGGEEEEEEGAEEVGQFEQQQSES